MTSAAAPDLFRARDGILGQSLQKLRWSTSATSDVGLYFCMWEAPSLKKNLVEEDRGGQIPRSPEGEHQVAILKKKKASPLIQHGVVWGVQWATRWHCWSVFGWHGACLYGYKFTNLWGELALSSGCVCVCRSVLNVQKSQLCAAGTVDMQLLKR